MTDTEFKIKFLGAAGTVTGSKTLIETNKSRILIDCGLFQGLKELRLMNWAPFPIQPSTIDAVLLTHAHLDHCGYIPLLVKKGFTGKIYCSEPTKELTEIILMDSAKIQEEDAERANSHQYTKHQKAEPLYTMDDVADAMKLFETHGENEWVFIDSDLKFELINNGHILGSTCINLQFHDKRIVFSGDMGRENPMILYPPKAIKEADYIVMESTYGDRVHTIANVKEELLKVIEETHASRGILMIPTFAVERTQELIFILHQLRDEGRLPNLPIYLDSPMGVKSTNVYNKYPEWQDISRNDLSRMYEDVIFVNDFEHSKITVEDKHPKIVLAGSGMMEGGRILHYMNNHIENERNTLLFVGFQGEGTRGRAIIEGSKEIKFFGEYRKINCKIRSISSLSGHADQLEMMHWLGHFTKKPTTLFLNHGEPHQADAFRVKISSELNWDVKIPKMGSEYILH